MIRHLQLKAYGKINLGLDVLRRRADGYHEVRMIMQTVGIFDRVGIYRKETPGISIENSLRYLPANESNLAWKAAALLMDEFSIPKGVHISLEKFIPVAAGMAGGSSDAAAVLFGMNRMFRLGLSRKELMERAVRLGADVPYCILRGTALAEGIGERLTPLSPMVQCQVVIARPGINVSTRHVYENLHVERIAPEEHPNIDAILAGIQNQDLGQICKNLGNILETVTIPENPVIRQLKETLLLEGADGALMSGSGPTVFGLFTDPEAARSAYETLRFGKASGLARQVYLTRFFNPEVRDQTTSKIMQEEN